MITLWLANKGRPYSVAASLGLTVVTLAETVYEICLVVHIIGEFV